MGVLLAGTVAGGFLKLLRVATMIADGSIWQGTTREAEGFCLCDASTPGNSEVLGAGSTIGIE